MTGRDTNATTRFFLVRHGEASGNRELRYLGASDVALTDRGREQARRLAQALRRFPLAALYTSPLVRAKETAQAIAVETGLGVQVHADLREGDFGAWELLTRAEVLARDARHLAAWEAGAAIAPPQGESLADIRGRVVACARALALRHAGETVALVSHVGPIKALVCAALGLPPAGAMRLWLDPASISIVDWHGDEHGRAAGILRAFNAVAHLDPCAATDP
jgi:broad specificity phosphatase PhoE